MTGVSERRRSTCNLKYDENIYSMFQPISIFHHHTPRVICTRGNDSNLLIVFYVQIMPDDFVMQLHRF